MPSVTVNNVKINYIEQGAGNEVLIFIHGYSGGLGDWREVLNRLPKEYHAYALDQRGHGQSEKPGSYHLTDLRSLAYSGISQLTTPGKQQLILDTVVDMEDDHLKEEAWAASTWLDNGFTWEAVCLEQ